ncbi:2-oxo acid dehydrogenase subunit E2 [Desulfoprunum benzoelyticum]|uniref:Dihydrolipoamide acetyltransferase component of pyruvate dehydrogenase complex n=1 Tax=Desulfoprunum benzoelyticum TaxID=1506996 RepID=A0A840UUT3_9BACT|nr:dihydrolipoamide acetyltransferase family protein [Desulfoprunum benzoelyticum]MBB5347164.1 pyruvate dehydrogenase E2 component (dihydrolipoamide acetyltransferase) [Desulfoprunum benzoelyticum]MBM9531368.1 2-oxo acid dehydrogenase subunit E2 [Desulfoprunum benzoelyticum]
MADFCMPSLGADMQEGTLVEWLVKAGDEVKRRDVIAVVETDKAAIEIEVYEDGVVEELVVEPGQKVPVGTVLAVIRSEGEAAASPQQRREPAAGTGGAPVPAESAAIKVAAAPAKPEPAVSVPSAPGPAAARIKASPYARRLAAERGLDLSQLPGTGPGGVIRAADVAGGVAPQVLRPGTEQAAPVVAEPAPVPPAAAAPPAKDFQAGMRRAIAAAMARSNREIPHYYLGLRIDLSRTLRRLEAENLKRPIRERILPVVPLIKAVALALGEAPELNGYWVDDRFQPQEAINIGFAIALRQGGLITPALLNADLQSLDELMAALRDLITRARSGGLRSSELTEATVTVTSLGDLGVETVYGVIYPPQVALVGFGRIMEQPWAENGMLAVRPVLTATLAADHRATDGHRGAQFLDALNRYLQEPEKL